MSEHQGIQIFPDNRLHAEQSSSRDIATDYLHECFLVFAASFWFISAIGKGCESRQDKEVSTQD